MQALLVAAGSAPAVFPSSHLEIHTGLHAQPQRVPLIAGKVPLKSSFQGCKVASSAGSNVHVALPPQPQPQSAVSTAATAHLSATLPSSWSRDSLDSLSCEEDLLHPPSTPPSKEPSYSAGRAEEKDRLDKDGSRGYSGAGRSGDGSSGEGTWGWTSHMHGLHALWRGLRGHIKAAAHEIQRQQVVELAKTPARASAWALSSLLTWRTEQQQQQMQQPRPSRALAPPPAPPAAAVAKKGAKSAVPCCGECATCSLKSAASAEAAALGGDAATAMETAAQGAAARRKKAAASGAYTAEAWSRYLVQAPLADLRTVALMSVLADLAYSIARINPGSLFQQHRLRLVTSSVAQKHELAAKARVKVAAEAERAALTAADGPAGSGKPKHSSGPLLKKEKGSTSTSSSSVALPLPPSSSPPTTAFGLASAAASYVQFRGKSLIPFQSACKEGPEGGDGSTSDIVDSIVLTDAAEQEAQELLKANERAGQAEQIAMVLAPQAPPAAAAAAAGVTVRESKKSASRPDPVCPCEWFICDDAESHTRYIVIQGSDSLASWQTNVTFDPVPFEAPERGVLVHRGIYEAAKALYSELLPHMRSHVGDHSHACAAPKLRFTGHSLGGSLATLLSLMLHMRGDVPADALQSSVHTFGAPSVMCGGDRLLKELGLASSHVQQVVMHRDLVPRVFSCDYPDHVAEVLRRLSGSFRDHPCLHHQKLLYAPMGTMVVLQPDASQAPSHPLLPAGSGLYEVKHPDQNDAALAHHAERCHSEVRAAQRAFLNTPHPLEILSDPQSYGTDGAISRDHDPRNYMRAIASILKQEKRRVRRIQGQQRRQMWWPLVGAEASGRATADAGLEAAASAAPALSKVGGRTRLLRHAVTRTVGAGVSCPSSGGTMGRAATHVQRAADRCRTMIASQHVQLGLLAVMASSFFADNFSSIIV
eukprot:jgi/Mesen1/2498/ME000159S01612